MVDSVELHVVLSIKHLWGYFQAFELQEAFYAWVVISISHLLSCEVSSEKTTGSIALRVGV